MLARPFQLLGTVHSKVLILKKIERFLETDLFQQVYSHCNYEEQQIINKYVDNLNKDGLVQYVKNKLLKLRKEDYDYSAMPITLLREIAGALGVPFYYNLPKDSLVSAIYIRVRKGYCNEPVTG